MTGINIELMDNIISNANTFIENSISNLNNLLQTIDETYNCFYSSFEVFSSFNKLKNGLENSENIKKMLRSYIHVLNSVKKSYIYQDKIFCEEVPMLFSNYKGGK